MKRIFWLWVLICFAGGFAACWIPWGRPDTFHGQGFPIPVVCWDKDTEGRVIPYDSFWGLLLNPIAYTLAGLSIWFFIWLIRRLVALLRSRYA